MQGKDLSDFFADLVSCGIDRLFIRKKGGPPPIPTPMLHQDFERLVHKAERVLSDQLVAVVLLEMVKSCRGLGLQLTDSSDIWSGEIDSRVVQETVRDLTSIESEFAGSRWYDRLGPASAISAVPTQSLSDKMSGGTKTFV